MMMSAESPEVPRDEAEAASGPTDWGALSPEILQQATASSWPGDLRLTETAFLLALQFAGLRNRSKCRWVRG